MTIFDVVLVAFPFSDLKSKKKRPCLILSRLKPKELSEHLIVAMITSNLQGLHFPFDFEIEKWNEAGLPKPSLVRPSKLVTIDSSIVEKRLGHLAKIDQERSIKAVRGLFKDFV